MPAMESQPELQKKSVQGRKEGEEGREKKGGVSMQLTTNFQQILSEQYITA